MQISFTAMVNNLDLVMSLVQILRVSPLRLKVITSSFKLSQIQSSVTTSDNSPKYVYQVILAPDANSDISSPLSIVSSFVANSSQLAQLKTYMPSFDTTTKIKYFELRPTKPRIVQLPKAKSINLYNATFNISFWEPANVYAIVLEKFGASNQSNSIA